jgi:hypothetical protein
MFISISIFFHIFGMLRVFFLQVFWSSLVVPIMPFGHTPARHPVHSKFTKPFQDPGLPLPAQENFDGVQNSNLKKAREAETSFMDCKP